MTDTTFSALQRLYATPGHEGVVNWFVAQALEKLGLVKAGGVAVILPPYWGPSKRLVKLTKAGAVVCERRASTMRNAERQKGKLAEAVSIPPAFWLGLAKTGE